MLLLLFTLKKTLIVEKLKTHENKKKCCLSNHLLQQQHAESLNRQTNNAKHNAQKNDLISVYVCVCKHKVLQL